MYFVAVRVLGLCLCSYEERLRSMVDSAPPTRLATVLMAPQDVACDRLTRTRAGHPSSSTSRAVGRPPAVGDVLPGLRAQNKIYKDDEAHDQVPPPRDAPPCAGMVPASHKTETDVVTPRTTATASLLWSACTVR